MNTTDKLFAELDNALAQAIVIPNSWLPEELHDKVRGGRTVARLHQLCDKRDGLTEHVKKKMIKARNIERLAAQVSGRDIDRPLDWSNNETDDIALHRNQMAMVQGMINGGVIEADDLLED